MNTAKLQLIQLVSPELLPYQRRWLSDDGRIKIWEKSRRIGATYVQALEDVIDCLSGTVNAVWFTSADESAAREYIYYCAEWLERLKSLSESSEVQLPAALAGALRTREISFTNNTRINALSSNPNAFRSKGGKVCIDEFAHHKSDALLWKAAKPCITWGFPLRILSTHNGKNSLFYKFTESVKEGRQKWHLHHTDIYKAAEEGIYAVISGKTPSPEQTESWLAEMRSDCFDEVSWQEEYCCIPSDEKTAFIPYELIQSCYGTMLTPAIGDDIYAGVDIGRKTDLTAIWRLIKKGTGFYTADVTILKNEPFWRQKEVLFELLGSVSLRRICIDATGIGMQLAEETEAKFGSAKVEKIHFTSAVKEELAFGLKRHFEDRTIYIPDDPEVSADIHSVRKSITSAGNIRFNAAGISGTHADRFWALALAIHAGGTPLTSDGVLLSTGRTSRGKFLKGFR